MKKLMLKMLSLCCLSSTVTHPASAQVVENFLRTSDNVQIAYDVYRTGHKEVIIIAHGWFMTKDSKAFCELASDFSKYYDIIVLDFRGHSRSSGKYTFGSKEVNDLVPIVQFAKRNYDKVYLMGFSLGSLISVDYCSTHDDIDKLILVSAPTDFKKIENHVWSADAFIPTLKKFEFDRWTSIRFSGLNQPKILPVVEIAKVTAPTFFIAGEKDPIIFPWHNEKLFEKCTCIEKEELIIKDGKHAEDLYLEHPKQFLNSCINWLKKD